MKLIYRMSRIKYFMCWIHIDTWHQQNICGKFSSVFAPHLWPEHVTDLWCTNQNTDNLSQSWSLGCAAKMFHNLYYKVNYHRVIYIIWCNNVIKDKWLTTGIWICQSSFTSVLDCRQIAPLDTRYLKCFSSGFFLEIMRIIIFHELSMFCD